MRLPKIAKRFTLDCGHPPSPHSSHTDGTAHMPDGRVICYSCADELHRAEMVTSHAITGYLSGDGRTITTWTGGFLASVTASVVRRVGFRGSSRVYFDAVDGRKTRWHGQSPGPGMYATMRRRVT